MKKKNWKKKNLKYIVQIRNVCFQLNSSAIMKVIFEYSAKCFMESILMNIYMYVYIIYSELFLCKVVV
jgi:hypothetical protein